MTIMSYQYDINVTPSPESVHFAEDGLGLVVHDGAQVHELVQVVEVFHGRNDEGSNPGAAPH